MRRTRVIIMGAAGRDFHNFNMVYRNNTAYEVVAFTATQIPNIDGRKYPAKLAGRLYPKGIQIRREDELTELIRRRQVDEIVFSYSDISFGYVMDKAALVLAEGADFKLLGPEHTMLTAKVPVIAVVAARTGAGKSQTSRKVCSYLRARGKRVVAIRHPMPYGNLVAQRVQRFASLRDLEKHKCTVEEMEEYEPHIAEGTIIYAGVDYGAILKRAEREADVIVWDGGNNDVSFYKPDLTITVVDPHRAGHELTYYPGATNVRLADVIVVNKVDSASASNVKKVVANVRSVNQNATIVQAASTITVDHPELIRGKSVLVVEDGPTLTHGEMTFGAGTIAAKRLGARKIVDPKPYAVRSILQAYKKYPRIGTLLPALGYGDGQLRDLERTINRVKCDTVVIGTPIDLSRIIDINKPAVRVRYTLEELTWPRLDSILDRFLKRQQALRRR